MAVAFAYIFMYTMETEIINMSETKPLEWGRYIDDVFALWDTTKEEIDRSILEVNRHHPTIKFTAEISQREINFLDSTAFKGGRFHKESVLNTHLNLLKLFSTRTSPPVTLRAWQKGKPSDFLERILEEHSVKKTSIISSRDYANEATETI